MVYYRLTFSGDNMAIAVYNESGISKPLVDAVLMQWGALMPKLGGELAFNTPRLEEVLSAAPVGDTSPYDLILLGFATAPDLERFFEARKALIFADFDAYCKELNLNTTESLVYYCGCSAWELITTRPERLVWGLARYAQWRVLQAIKDGRLTFAKVYGGQGLNVFSQMGRG